MDPQTIAHYRITGKLGAGGMGVVYRATDTKLGRDVAIKVLPSKFADEPERMERLQREAHVLASLNHPNIAAIYGIEEGALIMEMVDGRTLEGPLPIEEALPLARQIAEALEYAHEKGIIHRDLKPSNIKITPEGRVKLLDFGLAKALSSDIPSGDPQASPTITIATTGAGLIMGTAAYMSPERARGAPADRRTDIWSFGVVLFEMLTADRLFGGDTISDTLANVLKSDPNWSALPPDTPPQIRRLLRRCLARDRKLRLADIADARLEIEDAQAGRVEEKPSAPRAAAPVFGGKPGWWSIALAVIGLAALAFAVVHLRETASDSLPVRFQIPVPDKANFANNGFALSPDGRRLAVIATGNNGRPVLWVRALDSLVAQPLPGTEGVNYTPFWSPDSRSIAFLISGTLKKIAASGGTPQTLTQIRGTLVGGSWSRDGVILFGANTGGLFRVSAEGGEATPATTPDTAHGEIAHVRPWFLPDGRHFLYATRMQQPDDTAIYVGTLGSNERKRLLGAHEAAIFAPPSAGAQYGNVLVLRQGTLVAQPFDPAGLQLSGDPVPIAEHVAYFLGTGFFSASANGALAYRIGSGGGIQLTWFDRQGKTVSLLGAPAIYAGSLNLSPDGKHVAVEQTDQSENRDVWVLDAARGGATRFTFDLAQDLSPAWSADGSTIVFGSDRRAAGAFDIYRKDGNGSADEELLIASGRPDAWSPDGQYLLYTVNDPKTRADLWILPGSGDRKPRPYLQTRFDERQGRFSPDGRWIAYTSDESGQYQVYVQSFPAGGGKFPVSTSGGVQPRWRHDGREIFYIAADGNLMAADVKLTPKLEIGVPKALFDPHIQGGGSQFTYFRYDVSPDGQRFLVNSVPPSDEAGTGAITVVLNWQAK
jgi:serine/threonine protein kinase